MTVMTMNIKSNVTDFSSLDQRTAAIHVQALSTSDHPIASRVREALHVIDEALDTHGQTKVSISFNGGKDCTVLLHLFAAALGRRLLPSEPQKAIPALYIPTPSPFPELESFIEDCEAVYNLDLFHCNLQEPSPPTQSVATPVLPSPNGANSRVQLHVGGKAKRGEAMRLALQVYKDHFPHIGAILVGTRRGDPHGANLGFKNMTDADWPRFERVHPIINWSYSDIWDYLRTLDVTYCKLYDIGYTSLGSTYNTDCNPALLIPPTGSESQGEPHPRYRPAYELADGRLERAGRTRKTAPIITPQ